MIFFIRIVRLSSNLYYFIIYRLYGKKLYLERAAEVYAHVVVYYCVSSLRKIGIGRKALNSIYQSSSKIDVNANDLRAHYFWLIWRSARFIKKMASIYLKPFM